MTQGKLPLSAANGTDPGRIAAIVAERHGIVIPPEDPAWAIVTMNEAALEVGGAKLLRAVDRLMAARTAELRAALAAAEKQACQAIDGHARVMAGHLRNILREEIAARGKARVAAKASTARPRRARFYIACAALAVAIFAYGFLMGRV